MTTTHPPPKIAIIGAGIGGLALAIGLLKHSVSCTIYESASKFDAVGAGIGLGPNALRAMELMDETFATLYDGIKVGNTSPTRQHEQFEILSAGEGFGVKEKGEGGGEWRGGSVGHERFYRSSAHRKALLEVMTSLIPTGTVQFNKRVVKIHSVKATGKASGKGEEDRVEMVFSDGTKEMVDVVVGCDGIKGMTREVVLGQRFPAEVRAKYGGTYVYRHIVSMEEAKACLGKYAEDAKWFMSVGKGVAMYPISGGQEVNIVVFIQDEGEWEGEQTTRAVSPDEMRRDLEGFDSRILRVLRNAKPLRWPLFHHPNTPTYCNGRIALLGDSAHASSPSQAAGAGQGLEDALILSRLLRLVRRTDQVERALQVYSDIRQPRAQAVVQQSYEVMKAYYLTHPDFQQDLQKLADDANRRLPLLWWYDLEGDVRLAEERFLQSRGCTIL